MKKIILITCFTSTLGIANNFINYGLITNNNKNINNMINKSNMKINDNQLLFNNSFNILSDGSTVTDKDGKIISNFYITNQSDSNHKYYSYDLSHANYQLLDSHKYAYTFFIVDSNGSLQYTSSQQSLSTTDKNNLDNTKTQMEDDKKITSMGNNIANSNCIYNSNYFKGDNNNWQFLQFGGLDYHIDISSQTNGDKVDHYQDLSQSLGLYYIAKAVRQQKIDEAVADNLASYFISKSDFQGNYQLNDELVNKIIKLIVDNSAIYNFIYYTPFSNSNKNYSLNFIFDKNNNLVEIYYSNKNQNITISAENYHNFYADATVNCTGAWWAKTSYSNQGLVSWETLNMNYHLLFSNFTKMTIYYFQYNAGFEYRSDKPNRDIWAPTLYASSEKLTTLFNKDNSTYTSTLFEYEDYSFIWKIQGQLFLDTKLTDKGLSFQTGVTVGAMNDTIIGSQFEGTVCLSSIVFS